MSTQEQTTAANGGVSDAERARHDAIAMAEAERMLTAVRAGTTNRTAAAAPVAPTPNRDLDLLRNEVATETVTPDLPEGAVRVPLHDRAGNVVAEFVVLHPDDWPSSANEDVNTQRYFSWALKVLATEEEKRLWRALDPKNREAVEFINRWQVTSGNLDAGKGSS